LGVNSKKYIYSCHSFLSLASQKKGSKYSFLLPLINISQKRLGRSIKERERKVKERGQMSPLKKLSPIEHPKFSPKFFQSSKKRGMRSFSREQ
jgi:hypothetical protein